VTGHGLSGLDAALKNNPPQIDPPHGILVGGDLFTALMKARRIKDKTYSLHGVATLLWSLQTLDEQWVIQFTDTLALDGWNIL